MTIYLMNLETSALVSMLIAMIGMAAAVAFAVWSKKKDNEERATHKARRTRPRG